MPCLWGQHNNSQIFMDIGILDASSINQLTPAGLLAQAPQQFRALVDTGAQGTMISPKVVSALGLVSVGKMQVQGVGPNASYHNAYIFHVAFLLPVIAPGQAPVPGTMIQVQVHCLAAPIYGAELPIPNANFDVLLGMDVLATGSLKIEGNGSFSFSF